MSRNVYILLISIFLISSCAYDSPLTLRNCQNNILTLEIVDLINANCGIANGTITLMASGGNGNYTFSSDLHKRQESGFFPNLSAGEYMFYVQDEIGCIDTLLATIPNIDGDLIESISTQFSGCNSSNGSLVISAHNGLPPYTFKIDDGDFGEDSIFNNLGAGTYSLTVKDASNCDFNKTVKILSGNSFASDISPIITNNCAIQGCHNGSQFPDFRNFKNIQDNASQIKSRTQSKNMPQIGSLTQQEIDLIACWVDDGALDN